ncbi:putative recombination domain protein [Escherichia coli DEC1A]|nr:putative recombination domain protein [Escherichia coli DEC1A]
MKRAAVQWGIGRYLYNLEEGFAQTSLDKKTGVGTGQN